MGMLLLARLSMKAAEVARIGNGHLMDATRYLVVSGTHLAELAPGYLAHTGQQPGVKADYDPFH